MSLKSPSPPDHVTVLVFKDNFAARSFRIPIAWISRFSGVIATLGILTLIATYFALRNYRLIQQTDLSRVQALEAELVQSQANVKALELKATADMSGSRLQETQAGVPAPIQATSAPASTLSMFSALPVKISPKPNESTAIPVAIHSPKVFWQGKSLRVSFDIQYIREDKGYQQGRIILLARGPETLLGYPDGVLNRAGSDSLISPDQGEYFSVSRFREVRAEFGPMRSSDVLREVEVLLIGTNGQILVHEILIPANAPTANEKKE